MQQYKVVFTDLDGTLLMNDKQISSEDRTSLSRLGELGILRVIATGRNMRKVREVVPDSVPFDYVIFSSGAGIFDWQENRLVEKRNFTQQQAGELVRFFVTHDLSFLVFDAVPENHLFHYFSGSEYCFDFEAYLKSHAATARLFDSATYRQLPASQFLIVMPSSERQYSSLKQKLEEQFDFVKIIRSTSQTNPDYIWMEIFPENVSKGHGAATLCSLRGIDRMETIGIGNDYNDIDLLDFTAVSYLTSNAPDPLKNGYKITTDNMNSGVTVALRNHFNL